MNAKNEVLTALMVYYVALRQSCGTQTGGRMAHDARDQVRIFVRRWSQKTVMVAGRLIRWIRLSESKVHSWRKRYGRGNEHNGWIPCDFWL